MSNDLSDQQLNIGYWLVTHKEQLKKTFIGMLIAVNVGLWGYVIYGSTMLLINYRADRNAAQGLLQGLSYHRDYKSYNQAFPPEVISQTVISLGNKKYDLVAQVENINAEWAIPSLQYRFVWSGGETEYGEGFFLPGEKKFFLGLNVESESPPSDAGIEFSEPEYLKMTARRNMPPGSEFGLTASETQFVPAGTGDLRGGKKSTSSTVQFTANNETPYNLWSATYKAILYRGSQIVGANSVPVRQFLAGERRPVEMNWVQNFPQVTGVIVESETNWLDEDSFMPMQ